MSESIRRCLEWGVIDACMLSPEILDLLKRSSAEDFDLIVAELSVDQKVALVEKLLGERSELSVVVANRSLPGSVLVNQLEPEQLSEILRAIAACISKRP